MGIARLVCYAASLTLIGAGPIAGVASTNADEDFRCVRALAWLQRNLPKGPDQQSNYTTIETVRGFYLGKLIGHDPEVDWDARLYEAPLGDPSVENQNVVLDCSNKEASMTMDTPLAIFEKQTLPK